MRDLYKEPQRQNKGGDCARKSLETGSNKQTSFLCSIYAPAEMCILSNPRQRLVDGGAVVSAVDNTGRTARDCAEERGLKRMIEALDGGELSAFYIFEGQLIAC